MPVDEVKRKKIKRKRKTRKMTMWMWVSLMLFLSACMKCYETYLSGWLLVGKSQEYVRIFFILENFGNFSLDLIWEYYWGSRKWAKKFPAFASTVLDHITINPCLCSWLPIDSGFVRDHWYSPLAFGTLFSTTSLNNAPFRPRLPTDSYFCPRYSFVSVQLTLSFKTINRLAYRSSLQILSVTTSNATLSVYDQHLLLTLGIPF